MKMKWRVAAILLAVCAVSAGYLAYLGYFGGKVFVTYPVKAGISPNRFGASAVLLSGDMGINVGMGPQVASRLAAHGIPVVAINSLAYFRQQRTPAEVEALLADAERRALKLGSSGHVIIIGQSFGADMVQVGLTRLPPDLRAKISLVVLVVPTDTIYYRASPSELFNWAKPDAKALPTARLLTWVPTICIYGAQEAESLCPMLDAPNVRKVELPGGHMLHRDADALFSVIQRAIHIYGAPANQPTAD